MNENEQLHQDFLQDFTELLKKYKAEFEIMEGIPEVYFHYTFNEDSDIVREHSNFILPNYINPNLND